MLKGTRVMSIIGKQGSGKTYISKLIAKRLGAQYIEASDIVRELCGDRPRGEMFKTNIRTLQEPGWLANGIINRIDAKRVIVSGIREQECHDALINSGMTFTVGALWAPQNERFARLKALGKVDTFPEFIEHGENEMSIGLRDLLKQRPPTVVTSEHSDPDYVAGFIIKQLECRWQFTRGNILQWN